MQPSPSSYARLSRGQARLVLACALLLAAGGVAITLSPYKSGYAEGARFDAPTDIDLYNAEVDRIRAGEGYYQAAAAELRARGYPTRSIFNWRTPLPMWLIGVLPGGGGKLLLAALAVLLMLATLRLVGREGGLRQALLATLLLFGAVMPVFLDRLFVMPVLWAGILIALSASAYGSGHWRRGVVLGLAALACRDLAGPYCVLALGLAAWRRRWAEVAAWGAGLAAYFALFAWHAVTVRAMLGPHEIAHQGSWLQLGGAAFVISLAQLNAFLLVSPQWLSAVYLVAALLGLGGWQSEAGRHVALAACLYAALFAVVGHSFNQYWGCLLAPLLCLGAARCPAALADLLRAAGWWPRRQPAVRIGRAGA